jgi:hypothetical protein
VVILSLIQWTPGGLPIKQVLLFCYEKFTCWKPVEFWLYWFPRFLHILSQTVFHGCIKFMNVTCLDLWSCEQTIAREQSGMWLTIRHAWPVSTLEFVTLKINFLSFFLPSFLSLSLFFFFLAALRFELRASHLSHSTSPSLLIYKTVSQKVAQACLQLAILMHLPLKYWDYRCMLPCLAFFLSFHRFIILICTTLTALF